MPRGHWNPTPASRGKITAAAAAKPTGWLEIDIVGNERGVERMLEVIDSSLSATGLAAFLFGSVGPWVQQRAQERFKNEGDDVSGKWAPLLPRTQEIRENYGFGGSHPINKRTGQLEDYITQGQVGVVTSPGYGILRFPDNAPSDTALRTKVKTAQQGRAEPKTVARPVLGLNEKDLVAVLEMLAFHIQYQGSIMGVTP